MFYTELILILYFTHIEKHRYCQYLYSFSYSNQSTLILLKYIWIRKVKNNKRKPQLLERFTKIQMERKLCLAEKYYILTNDFIYLSLTLVRIVRS